MFSTVYKKILKPLLFLLQPETAHHFTFGMIKWAFNFPLLKPVVSSLFKMEDSHVQREVFGLKFSNPVGLAAGFDKDARLIDEMAMLGFGFIEIGTLTPKPQEAIRCPDFFACPKMRP